jgi:hypothetical protein
VLALYRADALGHQGGLALDLVALVQDLGDDYRGGVGVGVGVGLGVERLGVRKGVGVALVDSSRMFVRKETGGWILDPFPCSPAPIH